MSAPRTNSRAVCTPKLLWVGDPARPVKTCPCHWWQPVEPAGRHLQVAAVAK